MQSSKGEESNVEKAISEFLNEDNGPVTSRGAYDPSDAHYTKEQQRKSRKREMIREQEERKQVKKFKQAASKLGSESSDNGIRLNFKKKSTKSLELNVRIKPKKKKKASSDVKPARKIENAVIEKKKSTSSLLPVAMYSSSSSESDSDD